MHKKHIADFPAPPPPPSPPPPPCEKQPCTSPDTTRQCGGNWHVAVFAVGTKENADDSDDTEESDARWGSEFEGEDDDDEDEDVHEDKTVTRSSPIESPISHADAVTANDDDEVQMQQQQEQLQEQQKLQGSEGGTGYNGDADAQEGEPVAHPIPTGSPISHAADDDDEVQMEHQQEQQQEQQHEPTGP